MPNPLGGFDNLFDPHPEPMSRFNRLKPLLAATVRTA